MWQRRNKQHSVYSTKPHLTGKRKKKVKFSLFSTN
jgi:hypothetical protein